MSDDSESKSAAESASETLDASVRRAREALAALKAALRSGQVGEMAEQVSTTAAELLREGEELIENNETLKSARADLSSAVKRNPLGAVAIAFGVGLLVALLTRG